MIPCLEDPEFDKKMDLAKSVSYDEHFWALMTFKDPMKLYEKKDEK